MSTFRSRFIGAIAIVGALFSTASVASAAPGDGVGILANCPANTLCLYEHKDFTGQVLQISPGTAYPRLFALLCDSCKSSKDKQSYGYWNDQMSSWTNNTSLAYCWYWDDNYQRWPITMSAGQAVGYVGKDPNDQASSIQPC